MENLEFINYNNIPIISLDISFDPLEIFDDFIRSHYFDINNLISLYEAEIIIRTFEESQEMTEKNKVTQKDVNEALGHYLRAHEDSEECSICFDAIKTNEGIRKLPCDHTFHKKCVDKWFVKSSFSCPVCRKDFQSLLKKVEEKVPNGDKCSNVGTD